MIDDQLISGIQKALSKEPNVKLAYILGSVASGRIREDSDFDLAVVIDDLTKISYDQIYQSIANLSFPKDLDLSLIGRESSPLFLFQIISTGECIYQRSEEDRVSFETYVLKNYYDNAHLRNIYHTYLKDKYPYAD